MKRMARKKFDEMEICFYRLTVEYQCCCFVMIGMISGYLKIDGEWKVLRWSWMTMVFIIE